MKTSIDITKLSELLKPIGVSVESTKCQCSGGGALSALDPTLRRHIQVEREHAVSEDHNDALARCLDQLMRHVGGFIRAAQSDPALADPAVRARLSELLVEHGLSQHAKRGLAEPSAESRGIAREMLDTLNKNPELVAVITAALASGLLADEELGKLVRTVVSAASTAVATVGVSDLVTAHATRSQQQSAPNAPASEKVPAPEPPTKPRKRGRRGIAAAKSS